MPLLTKTQAFRSVLHLLALVGMMVALATPILHRFDALFQVNVDFFFFGQHQWKASMMPEGSKKKALGSIILTGFGTFFIGISPLLMLARYSLSCFFLLLVAFLAIGFQVLNMQMGVHFYNKSPGAKYGGEQFWGVGNTIHMACCGVLVIPIVILLVDGCRARRAKTAARTEASDNISKHANNDNVTHGLNYVDQYTTNNYSYQTASANGSLNNLNNNNGGNNGSSTANGTPLPFLIIPTLAALVLAVAGAGAPQASYTVPSMGYISAWHFDMVSSDYALDVVKSNLVCPTFYDKLFLSCILCCVGAGVAFIAFAANLMVPSKPLIGTALLFCGLGPAIGAGVVATGLSVNVIDCQNFWTNQGKLDLAGGLYSLYGGVGCGLIGVLVGCVTRNHRGSGNRSTDEENGSSLGDGMLN